MDSSLANLSNLYPTEAKTNPMAMDSNLFNAAVRGRIKPFKKRKQYLKQIVNESKDTILHVHISKMFSPSAKFVERIIRLCPELLLQVDDKGNTPIHLAAARRGKSEIVKVLLECARFQTRNLYFWEKDIKQIMLDKKNSDGKKTFDVAIEHDNIEVLKILIEQEDPYFFDFANNIGKLLNFAAKGGYHEILDEIQKIDGGEAALLKELRKYDDIPGTQRKDSVLHIHIKAREEESTQFMKKVLEIHPPLLLDLNDEKNTPLHVAAECNKYSTAKFLLDHMRNDQSRDPESRKSVITEMLKTKNSKEQTAFDLAVEKENIEVVNILIKEAMTDVFDDFANSISNILNLAAKKGHHEILDAITNDEKGNAALVQELSKSDNSGTPKRDSILHICIKTSSSMDPADFVKKILVIHPPLLLNRNDESNTLLHVAAECSKYETVKVLLDRIRDDQSQDPGRRESVIIEMLNMRNSNGKTAFDLAVDNGNIEVANILIKEVRTDVFDFADSISKILNLAAKRGYHEIMDSISMHEKGKAALVQELSKYENPGNQDTILHSHIESPCIESTEFVKKILNSCSSLQVKPNAKGDIPIHIAAACNKSETVEVLLAYVREHSEDGDRAILEMLKRKNSDEKTAFDLAVRNENIEVVKVLVKAANRYSFNFTDVIGEILNLAVDNGDHEILEEIAREENGKGVLIKELRKYETPGTVSKEPILHTHIRKFWKPSRIFVETLLKLYPPLQQEVDENDDIPIHVAVKEDAFDIVEVLLKHAKSENQVHDREERSGEVLFTCCQYEIGKVRRHDWRIWEKKNSDGKTILDIALENDKGDIVNLLITEVGPEFLNFEKNYCKILYFAARRGDYEMATSAAERVQPEMVLDRPIVDSNNPEDKQSNDTILHAHIQDSKKPSNEFMKEILDKCPSLLVKVNKNGETPLHVAAKCGRCSVVEFLLRHAKDKPQDLESGIRANKQIRKETNIKENKANCQMLRLTNDKGANRADWQMLRMTNSDGNTALHEALLHGKFEVLKKLIKADTSFPYSANNASETPLYLATMRGYYRMVHEILKNCERVATEGPNGMTALHAAVMNFDNPVANENSNGMTKSGDSDFDDSDSSGSDSDDTDSDDSGTYTSLDIMRELFVKKSSLTKAKDQYGWTPLHYASYYGLSDKADLLLRFDKSASCIIDNDRKMTALHMAASQGHKCIIEKIISKCVECCEMVDKRGWNVLHFAMVSLSKRELDDLLRNPLIGSLINKKNKDGNTPLHIRAAVCPDSFFHVGGHQVFNRRNIRVNHIIKNGSSVLQEEIEELFEYFGDGQYQNGVIRGRNDDGYFIIPRSEGRRRYYERLKETKKYHLLVATFIGTVTFAAAFTIPGGFNSEKGSAQGTAILNQNLAFQIFIMTDTVAMTLSLSAVFAHFIMTFRKQESLLSLALWLTMFSMGNVVVAFVTGIYAVLTPSLWLAVTICVLGLCFFVLVFYVAYWRVFLEWLQNRPWKLFKREWLQNRPRKLFQCEGGYLPIYVKKGN